MSNVYVLENKKPPGGKRAAAFVYEWLEVLAFAFVVIVLVLTFAFRVVGVEGDSMLSTLHNKDRLIISNLFFTPKQGDIVVISRNESNSDNIGESGRQKPLIKRIIAVAGQEVDIKDDHVYIDGEKIEESYISSDNPTRIDERCIDFPKSIPQGYVFVLGDNRTGSHDSRHKDIGLVDTRYILGKVVLRMFPIDSFMTF